MHSNRPDILGELGVILGERPVCVIGAESGTAALKTTSRSAFTFHFLLLRNVGALEDGTVIRFVTRVFQAHVFFNQSTMLHV